MQHGRNVNGAAAQRIRWTLQRRVLLIALVPTFTLLGVFLILADNSMRMGRALTAEEAAHADARELDAAAAALRRVMVCARVTPRIAEALTEACRGRVDLGRVPASWHDTLRALETEPDVRLRILAALKELEAIQTAQATTWREAQERRLEVDRLMRRQMHMGRISILLLAGMMVAAVLLALGIRRRTKILMAGVDRLRQGDLETRIPLTRTDELGVVAAALGEMSRAIEERNDALMRVNHDLAAQLDALGRAQSQRVAAERMEAIATLASGLSHELNNPLSYVGANVQFVRGAVPEGNPEVKQALAEAMEGVGRITSIVRDLRFITEGSGRREPRAEVDVRHVLEATVAIAEHRFQDRARLVKQLSAAPRVLANEGQLSQVFLDLVVHAADGLAPERAHRNELRVALSTNASGAAVVEIADNGEGLTPEASARLFEPFYVHPREPGRGSGLGLSVCKRILDELGGQISVRSAPGEGTRVRVRLPSVAQRAGGTPG